MMLSRRVVVVLRVAEDAELAFTTLRGQAKASERLIVRVVLMPSLVQLRRIQLPRMTPEEARRAVGRSVGRYFPDVTGPHVVAVQQSDRGRFLTAVASEALILAVYAAARRHGWEIDGIMPAQVAWARATRDGAGLVVHEAEKTLIEARSGNLVGSRRLRVTSVELPDELGAKPRVIAASAEAAERLALAQATAAGSALELVPEAQRANRMAVARRLVWWSVGASAALLMIAAALALWGEQRELNAVRARRAEIRPRVQRLLQRRDSIVEGSDRISAVAGLDQNSQRWSDVIARVSEALPEDAYLSAFRAEADSMSIEGQASNAAGVFAAMRSAPGLVAVRASAPVRQEGGAAGQAVTERFTMAARVSLRSAERETP